MLDTSRAEGARATHNLQASAASLASDPVSNLSQLPRLQSAQSDQHQQMFANCMAGVLPNTVVHGKSNTLQLDTDALQAMISDAHSSDLSSGLQHHVSDEQSRVALAVLLLGVWADKLSARLEHTKVSEADEDGHSSSGQLAAGDSSAVPALAHAPAAAAAATSASAAASTSSACAPVTVPASASASQSASESASEAAGHGEVPPGSPCSATAVPASQHLPCLMNLMSLRASDSEGEEDAEEELQWVPCFPWM